MAQMTIKGVNDSDIRSQFGLSQNKLDELRKSPAYLEAHNLVNNPNSHVTAETLGEYIEVQSYRAIEVLGDLMTDVKVSAATRARIAEMFAKFNPIVAKLAESGNSGVVQQVVHVDRRASHALARLINETTDLEPGDWFDMLDEQLNEMPPSSM